MGTNSKERRTKFLLQYCNYEYICMQIYKICTHKHIYIYMFMYYGGYIFLQIQKQRHIYQSLLSEVMANFNFSSSCFSVVSKYSAFSRAFIIRKKQEYISVYDEITETTHMPQLSCPQFLPFNNFEKNINSRIILKV